MGVPIRSSSVIPLAEHSSRNPDDNTDLAEIDAANICMTANRLALLREIVKELGTNRFNDCQAKMRSVTPQGEARRKQIETLIVDGNAAVLTARSRSNMSDEMRFVGTKEGWKIGKACF